MLSNNDGFTLIEVIVVIVILAILAGVAIPKYVGLHEEARNKAATAALAEGMARVNQMAAKMILTSNGSLPAAGSVIGTLTGTMTDAGDFSLAYEAAGTTGINITASGIGATVSGGTASGLARLPTT